MARVLSRVFTEATSSLIGESWETSSNLQNMLLPFEFDMELAVFLLVLTDQAILWAVWIRFLLWAVWIHCSPLKCHLQ